MFARGAMAGTPHAERPDVTGSGVISLPGLVAPDLSHVLIIGLSGSVGAHIADELIATVADSAPFAALGIVPFALACSRDCGARRHR